MSTIKTAFLGLGVMGYPMAGHLHKRGHTCTVYNRTTVKAQKWVAEYGGNSAATPAEAAQDADFVFVCVGNDDDLRQVVSGPQGAFSGMKPGAILVDHTTASDAVAKELHALAKSQGLGFVDGPVSGGQAGAENGQLTVMCGGDQQDYDRAEPVIEAYAKAVNRLGPAGAGQLCKMVNQITFIGILQSLSEALVFAEKAGLDAKQVVDVISKGAAQSWQMDNRAKNMVDGKFDYGFAIDLARKDFGICLDTARRINATLPITALIDQYYAEVQQAGGGRWDTSALITRLQRDHSA